MKDMQRDRRLWIAAAYCLLGWVCLALLAYSQAQAGEPFVTPPFAPSKDDAKRDTSHRVSINATEPRLVQQSPFTDTVRLYGYVTDRVTDLAIPGAYVEAKDETYVVLASMGADPAGFYDLSVPWRSAYIVCASDWGPNGDYWLQYHIFGCQGVSTAGAVEIQVDLALLPAGNLVMEAYDDNGDLIRNAAFASATDGYAFVTDLDGLPHAGLLSGVHDPYSQAHNWDWELAVPAFVVPTQTLNSLHVLWTVPAFGRVILDVDNNGQGYEAPSQGDYLVLNFNHEAAKSEVARLEREIALFTGQGYVISATVQAKLTLAGVALAAGEAHLGASPPEMAAAVQDFNEAVAHALFGQELLYLDKAQADIPRYRQGTVNLSLRFASGEPIAGAVVAYQQRTHDFLFSTGYLTTDGWNYDPQLGDLMEQMGANGASVMLEHAVFEPEPGVYDWTFLDQHSGLNPLLDKGWRIMGALAYYGSSGQAFDCPAYWSTMTFGQYKQHLFNHFQAVASRYGTRIGPWMINEQNLPWSNCLGLTWEQKLEVFQTVMAGLQAGYPEAHNLVTSLAIPYGWAQNAAPQDLNTRAEGISFPLYLAWLEERDLPVHSIGMELHFFGVTVPAGGSYALPGMTLASLARLMDRYDSYGVPIWIEPFQVPSQQEPGSAWWHRPWDQATQAEFAVKFYTLAFGRQNMHDLCWSDASDHAPFVVGGGLIDSSYQPKQVYYALRDLIVSWTTSGVGVTDENGALAMIGFAGDYTITVTALDGSHFQGEVHIYEQQETEVIIVLHKSYLPTVLKAAIGRRECAKGGKR